MGKDYLRNETKRDLDAKLANTLASFYRKY
jgi:hypothetical protein